jgi:hypothetical protein
MDRVANCGPCLAYEPLSFADSKSLHQLLMTSRDHENHFPFTLVGLPSAVAFPRHAVTGEPKFSVGT